MRIIRHHDPLPSVPVAPDVQPIDALIGRWGGSFGRGTFLFEYARTRLVATHYYPDLILRYEFDDLVVSAEAVLDWNLTTRLCYPRPPSPFTAASATPSVLPGWVKNRPAFWLTFRPARASSARQRIERPTRRTLPTPATAASNPKAGAAAPNSTNPRSKRPASPNTSHRAGTMPAPDGYGYRLRWYRELLDIADMLEQRFLSCLTARVVTDSRRESFPKDALERFERHSQIDVLAVERQRGGVAIGKCPLDRPFEVPQAKRPVVVRQQRIGALVA